MQTIKIALTDKESLLTDIQDLRVFFKLIQSLRNEFPTLKLFVLEQRCWVEKDVSKFLFKAA